MQKMSDEITILKRAVAGGASSGSNENRSKFKVPEPKAFGGSRNAKELENFLWDMEQYFKAAHISENEMVTITSMYLIGDAKLWWRTRTDDDDEDSARPKINSWEMLKKELKDQFLPNNAAWLARESMKNLRQTGTVRDYVKEFSSLLLDIKNMSDEDKLFNFISGLKPWAQAELRRQNVKDLTAAIAAADGLVDYKVGNLSGDIGKNNNVAGKGKGQKDKKKFKKKDGDAYVKNRNDGQSKGKSKGCYICGGPHMMKECPRKEKLNAIIETEGNEEHEAPRRVNPIRMLNALQTEEIVKTQGLLYMKVIINGHGVLAMVDTGATNSFVAERNVKLLGIELQPSTSQFKAVNSDAQQVGGVACVSLKIGPWEGKCKLLAMPLDDFDVILGIDFLLQVKASVMPYLGEYSLLMRVVQVLWKVYLRSRLKER